MLIYRMDPPLWYLTQPTNVFITQIVTKRLFKRVITQIWGSMCSSSDDMALDMLSYNCDDQTKNLRWGHAYILAEGSFIHKGSNSRECEVTLYKLCHN
jgi:hypothetical protein